MWAKPPSTFDTESLQAWSMELGIDELGVCEAVAYERAEQAIYDRRARGLFGSLKFTTSRPEVSCHPELLLDGNAVRVVSAALCYWRPDDEQESSPDEPTGRLARYTRFDAYAALTARLEQIAKWCQSEGYDAEVLVDSNHHLDREAAIRSGVGFSGKNTVVITRRHGSWVVLGTLVTSAPFEISEPMRPGCGSCTACIDACPTDAIVDGGLVLDATRCITYWTQSKTSIPEDVRKAMGDRVYGCDICQEVCPWNQGIEKRRLDEKLMEGRISLSEWLDEENEDLVEHFKRLFIPRNDERYLRRNALVALGNNGKPEDAALAAPWLDDSDQMLREHAAWALRKLGGPIAAAALKKYNLA